MPTLVKKVFLFGGYGDLAIKMLFPALYELSMKNLTIYAVSRYKEDENFKNALLSQLSENAITFVKNIILISWDYKTKETMEEIIDENSILYLSIPSHAIPIILDFLYNFNYQTIVIEKPFGNTFKICSKIIKNSNNKVKFVDHYLAKKLCLSMKTLKNDFREIFEVLSNYYIHSIEAYFYETIDAQERVSFDKNGVIKDVMQNHLLQIFCLIVSKSASEDIAYQKVKFIKSLIINKEKTILGQYDGYKEEMKYMSSTPTACATILYSRLNSWEDVPILLAAGKSMSKKESSVIFNVKPTKISQLLHLLLFDKIKVELDFHTYVRCKLILTFSPFSNICLLVQDETGNSKKYEIVSENTINSILKDKNIKFSNYSLILKSIINENYQNFQCPSADEIYESWKLFEPLHAIEQSLEVYQKNNIDIDHLKNFKKKHINYD